MTQKEHDYTRIEPGDTVYSFLLRNSIAGKEFRIERLTEIKAPQVILEAEKETLEELRKGNHFAGNLEEYKDWKVLFVENGIGRGGKKFQKIATDHGILFYFQQAKYGSFLKSEKELNEMNNQNN